MANTQIYLGARYADPFFTNTLLIQNFNPFYKEGLLCDFTENCWIMDRELLFCD